MNIDTGEIKNYDDLTDKELASRKWIPLTREQVQRLAQIETERLARRNNGVSAELVSARLARAEAKRQRRASKSR